MKKIILILNLLFVQSASAGPCADKLKGILVQAKAAVNSKFEKGTPCHKAAMRGNQTDPKPGCFPTNGALKLQSVLTPFQKLAQKECGLSCSDEGLTNKCNKLVAENYLKANGLETLIQKLSNDSKLTNIQFPQENIKEDQLVTPIEI